MRRLDTPRYVLGEGPVWDAEGGRLHWVDIDDGLVLTAPFDGEALGPITTLHVGGSVGAAIPLDGGRHLVALEAWIGILHPGGRLEKSTALIPTNRRLNDGKIDPQGRFVVGSLRRFGPSDGRQQLLRLEHDGTVTVLDDSLHLSNGLAWSPDGAVLYHADSVDRIVYRRAYGDEVGPREAFLRLDGMPDGLTVDADGALWVTLLDLHRVDCFTRDGERDAVRTVELPDELHPASVEFAGPGLDRLVITTGFPRLEDEALARLRSPDDGCLLVTETGSTGLLPTRWREAPLPR